METYITYPCKMLKAFLVIVDDFNWQCFMVRES